MAKLTVERLKKQFGTSIAVDELTLEVAQGEMVALLGPSGCGKTTTLRMIAGFVAPTSGRMLLGGNDITRVPPHVRETGLVFQSYALFPHMTVAENVGFGLEMRGVSRAQRGPLIAEALGLVRLSHLADRFPKQMSGGQQQRVALARALAISPKLFLLDEPLSNLDAKLRAEVRTEIRALQQRLGLTTLIVTHDREEALTMADRLVVMEGGRVRQVGSGRELYEEPRDAFVAEFVGRCNLLPATREDDERVRTRGGLLLSSRRRADESSSASTLAIRPERIAIEPGHHAEIKGQLEAVTYLGAHTEYQVLLGESERVVVTRPTPVRDDPMLSVRTSDPVSLTWDTEAPRLIPETAKD
ncbi:ABC transporter ATP-binding protein [Bradyrhizobium manausense]|uniref:ABC transporter ATP-binding protein n=1 Tax=Bradyrhizobium manausense TaxID=989370 RepID=UPI001BA5B7B1|nr:ABC transporter ATP-binding protein [Bradyrhizobium manausense]MBR0836895.1 ABC transporter ATP-binding protein [Bradyrhizobium manausense]